MKLLCEQVLNALKGKTLATAESCTGGGIGAAITAVSGSSAVYKGGIISYQNEIKRDLLGVSDADIKKFGPVSSTVAEQMAVGALNALQADVAVSVTGLAGPGGDEFGNPVGTVYIGYADSNCVFSRHFLFEGDRESVRIQAVENALRILLEKN